MKRLFLVFLFLVDLSSFISAKTPHDDFAKAVKLACPDGGFGIHYSASADWVLRNQWTAHLDDPASALVLGLMYSDALMSKDAKTVALVRKNAKRITIKNTETLFRVVLEGLTKSQLLDDQKKRMATLKSTVSCRLENDVRIAFRIAGSLRSFNSLRRAWLKNKETSLNAFEEYFLLSPGASLSLPAVGSATLTYDRSSGTAYLRRSDFPDQPKTLKAGPVLSWASDYAVRVKAAYSFGGTQFFYVLVTSDTVFTDGLAGKTLAFEPGHYSKFGRPDVGAVSSDKVLKEVTLNRLVLLKLLTRLRATGVQVLPDPPNTPYTKEIQSDGETRYDTLWHAFNRWVNANLAQRKKVSAVVFIHHNSGTLRDATIGYYGYKSQSLGRALAWQVQDAIRSKQSSFQYTSTNKRTYYIDEVKLPVPRALIEVQYVETVYRQVKPGEWGNMPRDLDAYAEKAASGIFNGLNLFFRGDAWPSVPSFETGLKGW